MMGNVGTISICHFISHAADFISQGIFERSS